MLEDPPVTNSWRDWFLPNWQLKLVHRLWGVRIALVGAILQGAYAGIPAFQYAVPPTYFMGICIGIMLAIVVARTMNQTGIDF